MDILGWNIPLWLILILLVVIIWYWHATKYFGVFKKYGIPGPRPIPGFGTFIQTMMHPKGVFGLDLDLKKRYKANVIGDPAMIFFDPEAVKQITVKDFNSFTDRRSTGVTEYPVNQMITVLKGDEWRNVRHQVSPTFSGKKLRRMTALINRCAHHLTSNLEEVAKSGDVFECKEYAGAFTMDVIASTCFNIDVNSKNDRNNIFVRMTKRLFNFSIFNPKLIIFLCFPFIVPYLSKLGFSVFDPKCIHFFVDVFDKAVKYRQEHPDESPNDFLNMMLKASESHSDHEADSDEDALPETKHNNQCLRSLSTGEIIGQSLIFFFAGYETTANAVTLTIYNLAVNPDTQEKAYQEIMDIIPEGEDPGYDDLKKLKYLEMCLLETIRMYPPGPQFDRECVADTEVKGIKVPKGMFVIVPVHALNNDPEVWPNPEQFDPERFTEEAKKSRHPFQYIPFGIGPRVCIGQRLAIIEAKVALVHVLRSFKVLRCDKTQVPIKLMKIRAEAVNGVWLKLEKRE
ncbi:hypothetical protein LSH36_141g09037 [Paralvinella palmiformis]|uniref:Cytochrome P450 n=1 Tax=Paralvinella palmiformis TaxID=53620 RepID=A0AAD9JVS6_9ANNE|nr:hypothetical protein LSH36_141g09037 [Paralvinella palmiformis]